MGGPFRRRRLHAGPALALILLLVALHGRADARSQDPSVGDTTSPASAPPIVDEILITGNDKTKAFVILREMSLKTGEEVTQERLDYDRERIYSLRLFNRVQVRAYASVPGKAKVVVEVNERWYIFPFPILGVRDRDWAKVFYGAGVVHSNFRGRNEKLFASLVLGYDPSFSLFYRNSFLDEGGDWFLDARTSYSRIRNRSPQVEALFGGYEERHFSIMTNVGRRIGRHHSAWVMAGYRIVQVPNENQFTTISGDGRDRFPVAGAGYMYDTRDLQEYPSRGTMIGVTLTRYGVPGHDLDFFRIGTDVRHFIPLPAGITVGGRLFTDHSGGKRVPAYSRVYFGYRERIRGHFDAIAEGENLAGATAELHIPLLEPRYLKVNLLPDAFNLWRFGVGAALFADAGTVWNRDGDISAGDLARGYGGGIHFLLPYSAVLRVEYAWNERREGELIIDLGAAL